jgi:DNA-binding NarL/FixJ family response regulator
MGDHEVSVGGGVVVIRAMIVDDEALVRSGLGLILGSAADIEVVAACDGVHAVEEVQRHRPDVVLLDLRMPGVDGLTVLRELARWPHPPAVAMLTTFDTNDYVAQALSSGAAGFLLKDTEPEQLMHAVRVLAGGGKILSPGVTEAVIGGYLGSGARPGLGARISTMTPRERDVLALIGEGLSNADIGRRLYLSTATVKDHVSAVLAKLAVTNRVQAAVIARDAGIMGAPPPTGR